MTFKYYKSHKSHKCAEKAGEGCGIAPRRLRRYPHPKTIHCKSKPIKRGEKSAINRIPNGYTILCKELLQINKKN